MSKGAIKLQRLLGETMRIERTARLLSQDDLAHRAGLSRNYYGCVERGEKMPSALTVVQVAEALELTAAEFYRRAKL